MYCCMVVLNAYFVLFCLVFLFLLLPLLRGKECSVLHDVIINCITHVYKNLLEVFATCHFDYLSECTCSLSQSVLNNKPVVERTCTTTVTIMLVLFTYTQRWPRIAMKVFALSYALLVKSMHPF